MKIPPSLAFFTSLLDSFSCYFSSYSAYTDTQLAFLMAFFFDIHVRPCIEGENGVGLKLYTCDIFLAFVAEDMFLLDFFQSRCRIRQRLSCFDHYVPRIDCDGIASLLIFFGIYLSGSDNI